MGKTLHLGRQALTVLLVVTLLGSSLFSPGNLVQAAPFVPGRQASSGAGTLEGLIRARTSATGKVGYRVNQNLQASREDQLGLSILTPPGSTGETSYGVRGLAVWEAPNRFLLRWVPDNDWIPEDGYSLFRIVDGQPFGLIDGLGTAKTGMSQVTVFNRMFAGPTLPTDKGKASSTLSSLQTAPSAPSITRFGDGLFSHDELNKAVTNLRTAAQVTDEVRQSLKQRNLIGQDLSNRAVEKALNGLKSSSLDADQTKIISGQQAFVSRFDTTMQQTVNPQFTLPSKAALPVVDNKPELARVRQLQMPPKSAPQSAPPQPCERTGATG